MIKDADAFISHASEDKDAFVRPLADLLILLSVNVFYDEYSLKPGDSLIESINLGMARSKYVILILSRSFLNKKWTNKELNAALHKYVEGKARIIPVLYGISHSEVSEVYPLLADIVCIPGLQDIHDVAAKICRGMDHTPKPSHIVLGDMRRMYENLYKEGAILSIGPIKFSRENKNGGRQCILSVGVKNDWRSRITVEYFMESSIIFTIYDRNGIAQSCVTSLPFLPTNGWHLIGARLTCKPMVMSLLIDGKPVSTLMLGNGDYLPTVNEEVLGFLGASLELGDPIYATIGGYFGGAFLDDEECFKFYEVTMKMHEKIVGNG